MIILSIGRNKAEIVSALFSGKKQSVVATILQNHPNVTCFLDPLAAYKLSDVLNSSHQASLMINDIAIWKATNIPFVGRNIICISPHPDDSCISAGATLNFLSQENTVSICIATAGVQALALYSSRFSYILYSSLFSYIFFILIYLLPLSYTLYPFSLIIYILSHISFLLNHISFLFYPLPFALYLIPFVLIYLILLPFNLCPLAYIHYFYRLSFILLSPFPPFPFLFLIFLLFSLIHFSLV